MNKSRADSFEAAMKPDAKHSYVLCTSRDQRSKLNQFLLHKRYDLTVTAVVVLVPETSKLCCITIILIVVVVAAVPTAPAQKSQRAPPYVH